MDVQSKESGSQHTAEDLQNSDDIVKAADLIQKLQAFKRHRLQIRIKSSIDPNVIHELEARRPDTVHYEDEYFIPRDQSIGHARKLIRIRKEADKYMLFVYRGPVAYENQRTMLITSETIPGGKLSS